VVKASGIHDVEALKVSSIKTSVPGNEPICLHFGMSTDEKISYHVLAIGNGLLAGMAYRLLTFTTSRADN